MIVYVQNVGQGTTEVGAVYVDGEQKTFTAPDGTVISEGGTIQLVVDGNYNSDTRYDIKVTTTDGTSMTKTDKPGTGGAVTAVVSLNPQAASLVLR
jgi:hypothetical protein